MEISTCCFLIPRALRTHMNHTHSSYWNQHTWNIPKRSPALESHDSISRDTTAVRLLCAYWECACYNVFLTFLWNSVSLKRRNHVVKNLQRSILRRYITHCPDRLMQTTKRFERCPWIKWSPTSQIRIEWATPAH